MSEGYLGSLTSMPSERYGCPTSPCASLDRPNRIDRARTLAAFIFISGIQRKKRQRREEDSFSCRSVVKTYRRYDTFRALETTCREDKDGPSLAGRSYRITPGMERRRSGGAREAHAAGLCRASSFGQALHGPRARGPHPADFRPRQ